MRKLSFILVAALLFGLLAGRWLERAPAALRIDPGAAEALAPRFALAHGEGLRLSWLEAEGSAAALRFAAIAASGLGPPQTVAQGQGWFVNFADRPGIHLADRALWIGHWLERRGEAPWAYGIRLALAHDSGQRWLEVGSPHPDQPSEFGFVSHLRWPDGRPGLVWLDGRDFDPAQGAGAMALRHAFLTREGRIEGERRLDSRVCECCATDALSTPSGPIVVFRSREAGEIRDVRMVHALGGEWSEPLTVHADRWRISACPVNGPRVAGLAAAPAGAELIGRVALAAAPDGRLWVAYLREDGGSARVELAAYDASRGTLRRRTVGRAAGGRRGGFPELAYDAREGLWAAWTVERDGRRMIELRRLEAP